MKADRRKGVRSLALRLEKRLSRERRESKRLLGLLRMERELWNSGFSRVAGVDEAGIGPLAGPVVAAAVILPREALIPGLDDSKKVAPEARQRLAGVIAEEALGIGVGVAEVEEIDRLNIYHAGLLAMKRAVERLVIRPEHLLVDARVIPGLRTPQKSCVRGDQSSHSIAAASIIAKTWRDDWMARLDRRWPEYGFARHKGYGTAEHQQALRRYGASPVHRSSFPVVRKLTGGNSALFYRLESRMAGLHTAAQLDSFRDLLENLGHRLPKAELHTLRRLLSKRTPGTSSAAHE